MKGEGWDTACFVNLGRMPNDSVKLCFSGRGRWGLMLAIEDRLYLDTPRTRLI